jgi:hypothetical protein
MQDKIKVIHDGKKFFIPVKNLNEVKEDDVKSGTIKSDDTKLMVSNGNKFYSVPRDLLHVPTDGFEFGKKFAGFAFSLLFLLASIYLLKNARTDKNGAEEAGYEESGAGQVAMILIPMVFSLSTLVTFVDVVSHAVSLMMYSSKSEEKQNEQEDKSHETDRLLLNN